MSLPHTRALVRAALDGTLARQEMVEDPIFGVQVPRECPGVPAQVLTPRATWGDASAYDAKALELAMLFEKNFEQFASGVSPAVRDGGPRSAKVR